MVDAAHPRTGTHAGIFTDPMNRDAGWSLYKAYRAGKGMGWHRDDTHMVYGKSIDDMARWCQHVPATSVVYDGCNSKLYPGLAKMTRAYWVYGLKWSGRE